MRRVFGGRGGLGRELGSPLPAPGAPEAKTERPQTGRWSYTARAEWYVTPTGTFLRCAALYWGRGEGLEGARFRGSRAGPPCKPADACGSHPTLRHCFLTTRCTLLRRGLLGGSWRSGEWGLCHLTPHPENAPARPPCARRVMNALYACQGSVWQRGRRPGAARWVGGRPHLRYTIGGLLHMGPFCNAWAPNRHLCTPIHPQNPSASTNCRSRRPEGPRGQTPISTGGLGNAAQEGSPAPPSSQAPRGGTLDTCCFDFGRRG
jgi:hypothetical protein